MSARTAPVVDPEKLPSLVEIDRHLLANALPDYIQHAWPQVDTASYVHGWHIDAISEAWAAVIKGEITRLLINVPPRHMKSLVCAVLGPTWSWGLHPELKYLFASYAQSLSFRDSRKRRILLQSPWYRERWPYIQLTGEVSVARIENSVGGYMIATSVGAAATGEGGDIIVVDDPHSADQAQSQAERESALVWWDQTMSTRLNDPKTGRKVIIMQRLHEEDLSGHVLAQGGYEHVCLPASFESRHPHRYHADPRRNDGDPLWPDHQPAEIVERLARELGSYAAAGQLQQRPAPAEGGIFRAANFRYYTGDWEDDSHWLTLGAKRVEKTKCRRVQYIDLAASTKTSADYSVVGTFAVTPSRDLVIIDVQRMRLEGPDQPAWLHGLFARWMPSEVYVEAVAYQLTLVQALRREGLPVRELKPDKDKVSRALVASVAYENEKIYHPRQAAWLSSFEGELLAFPNAAHDDQVDVVAYAAEGLASKLSAAWLDVLQAQMEAA